VFFMGLVVYAQGWEFGLPFASFMAAFTLLHELGHAFAARATGAEATIALDFMAGYASFVPTRPLSKLERAGISFAGPGVQILVGALVFVAIRGDIAWPQAGSAVQYAVLWAGPIIGLFNLIPVVPFDGGNIAETVVELFAPKSAHRIMIVVTVAVTGGAMVFMAINPEYRRFIFFAIVPLLAVAATLGAEQSERRTEAEQQALARSEALAWATGTIEFPPGSVPSPWFRAAQQLRAGHPDVARDVLMADLVDPEPSRWSPPDAAPLDTLNRLVDVLPRPLPQGRAYSSFVLSTLLLRLGRHQDAAFYAATAYGTHRAPMFAAHVARAAAALGDRDATLSWVRTAVDALPADAPVDVIVGAAEFGPFRADPAFAQAVSR
jgi:Zn-dependent protease